MIQIELGRAITSTGEIEFLRNGKVAAHIVRHPRQDCWLASIASSSLTLRKFRTHGGAVRFVLRACPAPSEDVRNG